MSLVPVEFGLQGFKFRYHPLPAMALAREHHKLLARFDSDSGALNTLAFTFEKQDFAEIAAGDPAGIFRLVKLLSMLVGTSDARRGVEVVGDDDDEKAPKPVDELPRSLDGLYLYYAALGKVEHCVEANGVDMWYALQTEDQFNAHPLQVSPAICTFHVLRGVFGPFVSPLLAYFAKVKEQNSTKPTSTSEETNELSPQT